MKKFFNINEHKYQFEIYDVTACLTLLNVWLIILGFWFAPIFGLINCGILLVLTVQGRGHINAYITQLALIILNIYFLKG